MDAAQTSIKKPLYFLASALLLAAPRAGIAQSFSTSATTVNIGSSSCNAQQSVTVASGDPNTPIPYTVAVGYPNGGPTGDLNGAWLYATVPGSGTTSTSTTISTTTASTTPTTANPLAVLTIGLNRSIGAVNDTGTVTLTPTNPAISPITITVFYTQNTSCGGNTGSTSNGFISITPGNVSISVGQGGQSSQPLSIQNTTGSPMTFGYSTQPSGQWLSISANSTSIAANGTTPVSVVGDASKVSGPGTYNGFVTITPQTGFGSSINIPVTLTVGNGTQTGGNGGNSSGTLTLNGATLTAYSTTFSETNQTSPGGQCVPIQDTAAGANSYSYNVTTSSGGNWLLANFNTSGSTQGLIAPTSNACVNLTLSNIAPGLPSGAYQGSVALTSSSGSTATINVTLLVAGGAAPGISVTPNVIFQFPNVAQGSTQIQQQVFSITGQAGYTLGTAIATTSPAWFTMTNPTASGNTETFTVTANPNGLLAGVYTATIQMTSGGTQAGTTTILVVLPVGQGNGGSGGNTGGTGTTLVAPTSLSFMQQSGSTFWTSLKEAQTVSITGPSGTPWSASIVYGSGGTNWLNFDSPAGGQGTFSGSPASLVVDLFNGVNSLTPSATPYTATINITTNSGQYSVNVSLLVTASNSPVLIGLPSSATFSSNNGVSSGSQVVQVVGSDNTGSATNPPITVGTPTVAWVTASSNGGNTMTINVNPAGQSTGVYSGTIPVSAAAYANPINYPVVLIVNGGGGGTNVGPLTLSTTAITFTNVNGQLSQAFNVTAASITPFTAATSETSCTGSTWLSISPGGSLSASSTATPITVQVSSTGIGAGTTCNGVVSLQSGNTTQTVAVSMTVNSGSGTGGNVTATPTTLPAFNYTVGQTLPAAQYITVVNASGSGAGIPFNVSTTVNNSSVNWLQASPSSGTTPANSPGIAVTVAPGNLSAGTYQGTVLISPNGGTQQSVNVTLNITSVANVTATPTTLTLNYQVGQTSPTQTIQVSGGGAAAGFTALASSGNGFLTVSPTSGTTPNTGTFPLTVGISPTVLSTLIPGTYNGSVTVSGTSPATGTTIVNVTLTVSAPLPTITGVTNAATGQSATSVSPGELISLYANPANPIGPAAPATTALDSSGKVATTLAGVQVIFLPSGAASPLTYVSAGQINAVVPYGVVGSGSSVSVEVKFLNQSSNAFPLSLAATSPGIFTVNFGTGQAAALQYDASGNPKGINSASNPAQVGWYLAIFMTGEGVLNPQPATGTVTGTTSPIPVPFVVPTVRVGNQPATVAAYSEAPGDVSGVLQVNFVIPPGAGTGAIPLAVSLGNAPAQTAVTVFLQ